MKHTTRLYWPSLILGFIFILAGTSCEKKRVEIPVKFCIDHSISQFKKEKACAKGAKVDLYRFSGREVYVFISGDCVYDMPYEVRDQECRILGYLGGFSGNVIIEGVNFYDNSTFTRTAWKN